MLATPGTIDGGDWIVAPLHAAIVYVPFLQVAFSTVSLIAGHWALCATIASTVLWLPEQRKVVTRAREK